MSTLPLTVDEVLTTTRSVRRRLDFDRPVDPELVRECLRMAQQAPNGSNLQRFHFVVVTDPDQRKVLAGLYQRGWEVYRTVPGSVYLESYPDDPRREATRLRMIASGEYLAERFAEVPVMVIPCVEGDLTGMPPLYVTSFLGSVMPAAWSFMLAARARGLGTCWTTLHMVDGPAADAALGLPPGVTQVALITVGHTLGTDFRPGLRRPLDEIVHVDRW